MKTFGLLIALILASCSSPREEEWVQLFNGNDLNGWDTWLAPPHSSYEVQGLRRDSAGNYLDSLGLNNDPLKVFTVAKADDQGMIHISGQGWGAVTTKEEFENFHLSLEFKWGEKRWAPRDSAKRDSGILYFCVGEHGAGSGAWMRSQECQVQEGDTGDYWSVAGAIADVHAKTIQMDGEEYLQYDPTASLRTIGRDFDGKTWRMLRCIKKSTHEKPRGEWNNVEIYTHAGKSVHVVNGNTVMVLENSRHLSNGVEVPLTKGKIQLQSEGAEVYYRNIRIRPIENIPAEVLK